MGFLTDHIRDTGSPQSYLQHGYIAGKYGFLMIFYGLIGILHAIFPFWFKFTTSSFLLRTVKLLIDTRRHSKEIEQIMPDHINTAFYKEK